MKWVSSHAGTLHVKSIADDAIDVTSSSDVDVTLSAGDVHELLFDAKVAAPPGWLALLWARDAIARAGLDTRAPIVWLDADRTFYPPAAHAAGIAYDRLCLLRPPVADVVRTVVECLRCPGVAGVVASVPSLMSRVETRRLQLAVEKGGGVGLLMRPLGRGCDVYAAATRWQIAPAPSLVRASQRWRVEQVHGHGRQLGQSFFVEYHRARIDHLQHVPALPADAGVPVRPTADVVDRPPRTAFA